MDGRRGRLRPGRERTFKIKIASAVQPVPPDAVAGTPVRPVVLEGLTVAPYIQELPRTNPKEPQRFKIAYSLRCTGVAAPRRTADAGKAA